MSQRVNQIIGITSLFLVVSLVCSCAKVSFVEPYEGAVGTGTLSIRVSVGDENPLTEGVYPSSQRTIAPEQIGTQNLQNYTFKLYASNYRQTLPEQTITLVNNRASLASIPLGTWQLRLVAYNQNQEVLEGFSAVTVVDNKNTETSFILTPVKTGNGSVRVQFTLNSTDFNQLGNNDRVHIALYNIEDYSIEPATERTPLLQQNIIYNLTSVPVGVYILRLTITAGANSSFTQNSFVTWADTLYVEPQRESTATIILNQLFQKPTAPTNLRFTNESPATTVGTIPVALTWGGSHNANSYELEVLEHTSTQPITAGNWATVAGDANSKLVIYNAIPNNANNYLKYTNKYASQYYREGGLLPGQNTIKLGLQISAKSYAARIRATNFYGDSSWVYFTAPATGIPTIAPPTAPTNFDFNAGAYDDTTQSFFTTFTWQNTPTNNEEGFELELMQIKGNFKFTPPTTNNAWDALATGTNTVTSYKGNNLGSAGGDPCAYKGGSLLAGSTSAQVSIKRHTGTEYYTVRLRAYNSGGESAWVYPTTRVNSAGTNTHPKILMPYPYITYTSTAANGSSFTATITVKDIQNSGCFYQYELASSTDFTSIFNKSDLGQKNTAWTTMHQSITGSYRSKANNPQRFTISGLPANISLIIRIRVVTLNAGLNGASGATPWYYYTKTIVPGKTN